MKTIHPIAPNGTAFSLPMMAVFSVSNHVGRSVAHALDFDLVAVAKTEGEAVRKLRIAVKHHVEFGLKNNFELDILQKAPDESWAKITLDSKLRVDEPIEVCHRTMLTATAEYEDQRSLTAA